MCAPCYHATIEAAERLIEAVQPPESTVDAQRRIELFEKRLRRLRVAGFTRAHSLHFLPRCVTLRPTQTPCKARRHVGDPWFLSSPPSRSLVRFSPSESVQRAGELAYNGSLRCPRYKPNGVRASGAVDHTFCAIDIVLHYWPDDNLDHYRLLAVVLPCRTGTQRRSSQALEEWHGYSSAEGTPQSLKLSKLCR